MQTSFQHETVLLNELVDSLNLSEGDTAVDCTLGGGGHTEKMLTAVGKTGQIIGIDRDPLALEYVSERFKTAIANGTLKLFQGTFSTINQIINPLGVWGKLAGVCADVGVSSPQVDDAKRGFSFINDGPLDMRMDRTQATSAATIIEGASHSELAKIFRDYGEEPKASYIAKKIIETREESPFMTTAQLAGLIETNVHYKTKSRRHPATRVFQALRIAVNNELGELSTLVSSAFTGLRAGGRLSVISFHSLEDRIVKKAFVKLTGRPDRANLPKNLPLTDEQVNSRYPAAAKIIKPFPLKPSKDEVEANPRSRSAKLRIIEKL